MCTYMFASVSYQLLILLKARHQSLKHWQYQL